MDWRTFLGGVGQVAGPAAQMYGQQNAAEAVSKANTAAIGNQTNYLGNIGKIYDPYISAGKGAVGALGKAEGINGGAPDYSGFEHMPGYQFAIDQGTQAIRRQAAASGSAYTPNTGAAIGQYVTGTAMQDYNTYIDQLQRTAGMGETASNQLGNITYNTGANTSQLMANTGQAEAGKYTGMGQSAGGALGGYLPGYGGGGGYGAAGASGVGGLVGGIGNIVKGIGSMFGGGNNRLDPNNSGDMTGGQYNGGAFGGGAPYFDPSTGGYPGQDFSSNYGNIPMDSNNNPFWDTGGMNGGFSGDTQGFL